MFQSGAEKHRRLTALMLMVMMLFTTWQLPAYAASIWDSLTLNVLWTDGSGNLRTAAAAPVTDSADRAYWVTVDASAIGHTLTVEALASDPSYTFYLVDDMGERTTSLTWLPEMDALSTGYEFAYQLWYSVNGQQADMPILLYVSSADMPKAEFQPYPVQIPVYFITEDGLVLDTQYAECWAGETTRVWASSSSTEGYALVSSDHADVTVDQSGSASPSDVTFLYREVATPTPVPTDVPTPTPVAEVSVPVVYMHTNGTQLDFQEIFLVPGTHEVTAFSDKVSGYQPVSTTAYITVYPDGTTDVPSIIFTYEDIYVAPVEAAVPVYYYHENGTLLDAQEKRLTEGTYTITADSANVWGYELVSTSSVNVTVFADGTSDPAYVQFTYKDAYVAPVEAVVPVYYYHENGTLLDAQEKRLTEGTYTITADSANVWGYELVSTSSVNVTVSADGTSDPAYVQFTYKDAYVAPVTADLTILYQLSDGTVVASDTKTLQPGHHIIEADAAKMNGYVLERTQTYEVTVDESGRITPDVVIFDLRKAAADITVHYQDDLGRDVAPAQVFTYADGIHVIYASPEGLSSKYELAPGSLPEITIEVKDGVANMPDVYFFYQEKQDPVVSANVTIWYLDMEGSPVADPQVVTLDPGTHPLTPSPSSLPEGAVLVEPAVITVTVDEFGRCDQEEIAFYYRLPQEVRTATVMVYYKDDRGNDIATAQALTLADGTHTIVAAPADLPDGYAPFAGMETSETVTVTNGVASRAQIVFYYQKVAEPQQFVLPVYYYDTEGRTIATSQTVTVAPGTYSIQANPQDLPAGYTLAMDATQTVTVRDDGTTEPEEIAFYYKAPEKKAKVTVRYVNERQQDIITPFTLELASGYHTVEADASLVPSGYDASSAKSVKLYVSRDGVAEPAQVVFTFAAKVTETPIPVGENVYRYAVVNGVDVAFRNAPNTSKSTKVIKRIKKNTKVYVLQELYNDAGETWAMVNIGGTLGYMSSTYLDIMTQAESDQYAAGNTPVPTFTPVPTEIPTATPTEVPTPTQVPTATPTEIPTTAPTEMPSVSPTVDVTQAPVEMITPPATSTPTAEPDPTETASPTPTTAPTASPSPTPYAGYALTTRVTPLRTGISSSDMTIQQNLEAGELVKVFGQVQSGDTADTWSIVTTLGGQSGYIQDSSLRRITDTEAEPYIALWEEQHKTPTPTVFVTATPEPPQISGYAVVLGEAVPFRQMASEYSRIIDNLAAGTIVFISGQTAGEGQYWHNVLCDNQWGYIRYDLVRMMTVAEEEDYIENQHQTPTPVPTVSAPVFDENGLSSYGYVDGSTVNWREQPSTNAKKVGELKRYALCLVLGSENINGTTWYRVKYADQTGYLHGDYFKQLTIAELEEFRVSDQYLQGVVNNSTSKDDAQDNVGFTGTGGLVSAEDQWVNSNPDVYTSFEPFNPIPTVAPIQTTPTLEPLPNQSATPTPTATPTFNPLPDVTYPTSDDGQGGSGLIWTVVVVLLLLAGGGAFAFVRYQQKRRRMAMRAAQRRAQAARAQQQRPYARSAQQQQRTGAYPNQAAYKQPMQDQQTGAYQPAPASRYQPQESRAMERYARPAEGTPIQGSDFTPDDEPDTRPVPRVGRRTAQRQMQENSRSDEPTDI